MFLINVPQKAGAVLPKDVVKEFLYIDYFDAGVKGRKVVLTPIKITPAFPQVVF